MKAIALVLVTVWLGAPLGAADVAAAKAEPGQAAAPLPADAASRECVVELLTLLGMLGNGREEAAGVVDNAVAASGLPANPQAAATVCEEIGKLVDENELAVFVSAWRREMPQATVDAALAFFKSPAGVAFRAAEKRASKPVREAQSPLWSGLWKRASDRYRELCAADDARAAEQADTHKKDGF